MEGMRVYAAMYGKPVRSNHPLLRLVHLLPKTYTLNNATEVYERVRSLEDTLATQIGGTTPIMLAAPLKGVFYDDSYDYLLRLDSFSYMDSLDINEDNWMDMAPCTVVTQPYILNPWHIPHGNGKTSNDRYSVIGLSVTAFAVMHYYWSKRNNKKPELERETLNEFIGRYVLPGMSLSQIDSVYKNVLIEMNGGVSIPTINQRPLYVSVNRNKEVFVKMRKLVDDLSIKDISGMGLLNNLPSSVPGVSLYVNHPQMKIRESVANYTVLFIAHLRLHISLYFLTVFFTSPNLLYNQYRRIRRRIRMLRTIDKLPSDVLREEAEEIITLLGESVK